MCFIVNIHFDLIGSAKINKVAVITYYFFPIESIWRVRLNIMAVLLIPMRPKVGHR